MSKTPTGSPLEIKHVLHYQIPGGRSSYCHLNLILHDVNTVAVLTEPYPPVGTSVTNMIEELALRILQDNLLDPNGVIWLECRVTEAYNKSPDGLCYEYHLIQFNWNGETFSDPRWCLLRPSQVDGLVGREMPHFTPIK